MNQFKFSLGPYELFSSIIVGVLFILSIFLIYQPILNLIDLSTAIIKVLSLSSTILLIVASYILGTILQLPTWRYFTFICKIFKRDYNFWGNSILQKIEQLNNQNTNIKIENLEFDDRLAYLLLKQIGKQTDPHRLDNILMPYLRQSDSVTATVVDNYSAQHIMYRGLSIDFIILIGVYIINTIRCNFISLEIGVIVLSLLFLSYISFRRSITFRGWSSREILIGFYHIAYKEFER